MFVWFKQNKRKRSRSREGGIDDEADRDEQEAEKQGSSRGNSQQDIYDSLVEALKLPSGRLLTSSQSANLWDKALVESVRQQQTDNQSQAGRTRRGKHSR